MERTDTKTITRNDILMFCAFFASFLHSVLGLAFLAILFLSCFKGKTQCIKVLLLLTARGIMSSAVAAAFGNSILRLAVIFTASLLVFCHTKRAAPGNRKVSSVLICAFLFAFFALLSSLLNSSYPVVAVLKIFSFVVPFVAVLCGVTATREYRWKEYFVVLFGMLFAVSFVLIPFDRFRIVNADFQGVFNHVNCCGIVGALYIAVLLHLDTFKKYTKIRAIILILTLIMIYLSASRTGLFSALLTIAFYYAFSKESKAAKVLLTLGISVLLLFFVLASRSSLLSDILETANEFIYKSNAESIWSSRSKAIAVAKEKFANSNLFGSGFMVPWMQGFTSYELSFDLVVEPGNIVWSILGDTGIVGAVLFVLLIINIFSHGEKRNLFLLIAALSINMGEMVFFSSNNMAILVWFVIALYLSASPQKAALQGSKEGKQ